MDNVEREVRAALNKREWDGDEYFYIIIDIKRRRTEGEIYIFIDGIPYEKECHVKCSPSDTWAPTIGYELAYERLVQELARRVREHRAKPKMPVAKKKVVVSKVSQPYQFGYAVWCDPGMKDAIMAIPGVSWIHRSTEGYDYIHIADPRYDVAEVIAAIKALGGDNG